MSFFCTRLKIKLIFRVYFRENIQQPSCC